MNTASLLQFLLSGLMVGTIYSLVGLGLKIVFNATGAVNFAQGELSMLGASTFSRSTFRLQPPAARFARCGG